MIVSNSSCQQHLNIEQCGQETDLTQHAPGPFRVQRAGVPQPARLHIAAGAHPPITWGPAPPAVAGPGRPCSAGRWELTSSLVCVPLAPAAGRHAVSACCCSVDAASCSVGLEFQHQGTHRWWSVSSFACPARTPCSCFAALSISLSMMTPIDMPAHFPLRTLRRTDTIYHLDTLSISTSSSEEAQCSLA